VDSFIYVYGGFELDSPNIPTDQVTKINLTRAFSSNPELALKINTQLRAISPPNQTGLDGSFSPS